MLQAQVQERHDGARTYGTIYRPQKHPTLPTSNAQATKEGNAAATARFAYAVGFRLAKGARAPEGKAVNHRHDVSWTTPTKNSNGRQKRRKNGF